MSYCVVPECEKPQNPDTARVCFSCGSKLWLKDRYRSLKPIGQGGFGRTFLAVDEDIPSKPNCVVKQLDFPQENSRTFQKAIALFHGEAVRLDGLGKHPQIPSLLAHFEQDQRFYLVQELIEGQTLAEELKQKGSFSETQIWELLQDLLPVLQYVHEHQVIHRDVKPQNIMRRKGDRKLVLIDFGIAKLFAGTAAMQTGTIIGSPEYMAPEQRLGKAVPASDLYSLGLTCIHLLTGYSPSSLYDLANDRWAWRDYLPTTGMGELLSQTLRDRLGQILDKLLKTAVNQRYLSAAEVLRDLNPPAKPAPSQKTLPQKSSPARALKTPQNPSLWRRLFGRSQVQPQDNDVLTSEVGVDYAKLRDLLAAHRWKEADKETRTVLCQARGKRGGYLDTRDIENLPCTDLQTIDKLWVKYSSGRFGFSVQKRIYDSVEGDYGSFCDRLGWPPHNPIVPEDGLTFNSKAPEGHLPSRIWAGGAQWWRHAGAMSAKLSQCNFI